MSSDFYICFRGWTLKKVKSDLKEEALLVAFREIRERNFRQDRRGGHLYGRQFLVGFLP